MKHKTLLAGALAAAVALGGGVEAAAPSLAGGGELYGSFLPQYAAAFARMTAGEGAEALEALGSECSDPNVPLADVACYYADLDGDGQAELLLINGKAGYVQDVYTLNKVGQPRHIISGWARNRYYLRDDGRSLYREGSGGASESVWETYKVLSNGEGLQLMERLRTSRTLLDGTRTDETNYFHQPSAWGMEVKIPGERAKKLQAYFEKTKDMPDTAGLPTLADYYRQ